MNRISVMCVALLALTLAAMGHVCACDFTLLDDPSYVTQNPHVQGGLTWSNIEWAFTGGVQSGFWFPLVWLSFQLDASLFGLTSDGAWGFHLHNLLLHCASIILFFWALQRSTGDYWRSAVIAAIFAVHPLRVESVAWVTERKDVLGMFFLTSTIAAYVWYAERPGGRRYSLLCVAFLCGLMSKITVITLPFGLLLLDYWPLYRLRLGQMVPAQKEAVAVPFFRLIVEKIPLLLGAVTIGIVDLYFVRKIGSVNAYIPWIIRLAIALSGYLTYLGKTFWPADLAVIYPAHSPVPLYAVLAFGVLATITVLVLRWRRSMPQLTVGWLWYLGTLVPFSGVIQVGPQNLADRFTYVPHLGLIIALVYAASAPALWKSFPRYARPIAATTVIVVLAAITWSHVWNWQNSERLFRHTLAVTTRNHLVESLLGDVLYEERRFQEAEVHLGKAHTFDPLDKRYRNKYAQALIRNGRFARLDEILREPLEKDPSDFACNYLLGQAAAEAGAWNAAQKHLELALGNWGPKDQLTKGKATLLLGAIYLHQGAPAKAINCFEQALQVIPDSIPAQRFLGVAFGRLTRWQEAAASMRKLLNEDPNDFLARAYLPYISLRAGRRHQAAVEYAELTKRFPDFLQRLEMLITQVTTGAPFLDFVRADELSSVACEATDFQDARALIMLAAVHAAKKDFAKAQEVANRALALTMDPELIRQIQDRLRVYSQSAVPNSEKPS